MNVQLRLTAVAAASLIALAGCASTPYSSGYAGSPPPANSYGVCSDCGVVTRIEAVGNGTAPRSGVAGGVIGGVIGAAAGHELTKDSSNGKQNVATVAGAVAGAAAGAAVDRNMSTSGTSYNVYVRMNDGRTTMVSQTDLGGIGEGSAVRVYNGRVWAR
ncbi:glycine zipper 2TM domain-containing protein [Lysobacter sp. HA35]